MAKEERIKRANDETTSHEEIRNYKISSSSLSKSIFATRPQRKMGRSILPCSFTANAGWIKMIQLTRSMDRAHPAGVEWENKEQTMCTVFCGKKVSETMRSPKRNGDERERQ